MQFSSARTFVYSLAFLFSASLLPQTHAQSLWNTASDGDWSNASNWSLGVPNGVADDAEINASGVPYIVTGDIDVTLNLLTLDSTDATLLLTSRNWTVNDKIQIDAGTLNLRGTTSVTGNVVNGGGSLHVLGAASGGHALISIDTLTNNGTLILDSIGGTWNSHLTGEMTNNGLLDIQIGAGGDRSFTGTMHNNGNVLVDQRFDIDGASVWNQNSGTITGNVLFAINTGSMNIDGGALSGQVVVNDGTINVLGTSTATGAVQSQGITQLAGTINDGLEITIQGASNGAHATGTTQAGFVNQGVLALESINGTWGSDFDATLGFTNGVNGTFEVRTGAGGSRDIVGDIVNQGIIDGSDAVYRQTSGSLALASGQLIGEVKVLNTSVNTTGSTTGDIKLHGNANTLSGTINSGLTVRVRGAGDGGHATTAVGSSLTNNGTLILDSINGTWGSHLTGEMTNNGLLDIQIGASGDRSFTGTMHNNGDVLVDQRFDIDGASVWNQNSGTITGNVLFAINTGSMNIDGGALSGQVVVNDGTINVLGTSTATGAVQSQGITQLAGTINDGLEITIQGASNGAHATGTTQAGFVNQGVLALESINGTWGSDFDATLGFTNGVNGTFEVRTGAGGSRDIVGDIVNQGIIDGTDAAYRQSSGSLALTSGQLIGEVKVLNTSVNTTGSTTGDIKLHGNANTLSGTINSGLTVRVRGAGDGGHATTAVGSSLTNNGTLILDAINSTWGSNLTGEMTNNGLLEVQIGTGGGGGRSFTGTMNNNGDVLVDQRFDINGASVWNQNSGTITGNGLFAINAGTMNIDGGALSGQVVVDDGTINVLGTSTATGAVQARGITQLTGTINDGLEITVQGSSNGAHANITTVGTLNNAGRIVFESRDSSWGSNLSGSLLNMATGLVEVNVGTGGSRNLGFTLDNDGEFLFRANANLGIAGSAHENRGTLTLESARLDLVGDTFENSDLLDGYGILDLNNSVVFSNSGLVDAHDGTLEILGTPTNYDTGTNTLTGGSYRAQAAATLKFTNADIDTNQAEIILDGIDSAIVNQSNVDALADLSINDTGAALRIVGGRDFTTTADLTNRGEIELGGGVFDANSIANTVNGSIVGFGTVTPRPNNLGAIQATGGTLALAAGVHGLGTLEATAGSTLDISAATNDSNTRQLTLRNTGTLALGNKNISVVHDYFNENAGTGNAFDPRNGVTGSGSVNSGVSKTQTLSGDVTGGSTTTPSLALGAVRIGVAGQNTTTGSFSINNPAGGPMLRGAIKSSGNGANLAGESQLSITGGPRNFGPIAASGHSEDFEIAFTGSTPGSVSRKVALVNNFDNIAGQLVTVTAEAFNPAVPNITPDPIALGDFHVGATAQQAISIANNAPAGAFSESLVANATAAGAQVSITGGPSVSVAAGGSNSSIGVAVNTSTAGAKNGNANIARSSTGATGLADLNLGTQPIPVSASVYRFAQPTILNAQPVDFGIVHVGDTISPVGVAIKNNASADGFSERLDASFTGSSAGLLTSGSVNNLAAGSSNSAMTLSLNTTTAGVRDGQATVAFVSDGSGVNTLGQTPLGTTDVQVTATVNNFANPALSQVSGDGSLVSTGINEFTLDFGVLDLNAGALAANFEVLNDVSGPADTLAGTWSLAAADFSLSGFNSFNNIAAGNALDALQIGLSSATPGAFSGSLTLSPRSENASGFSGSLDDITLLVQGIVASPADFNEDGSVDGSDLNQWESDFGVNADSDSDNDLDSDGGDFLAWQRQFTGNASLVTASTGVPEPSSLLLSAMACIGVFLRRNR